MANFESVVLIKKDITDELRNETLNKIYNLINSKGKVQRVEEIGIRRMAYEVKGYKESYYVSIYLETDFCNIKELEDLYRSLDEVLKFITVKIES